MNHVPPLAPADELLLIDRELAQLDARRGQLLQRRAHLLHVLHVQAIPAASAPRTQWGPAPAPPPGPAAASSRSAQNVLLTLGGILLAVAALAFTLVGWGQLGIAGRAAVLTVVTLAALAAPALLVRRGLVATAESVGVLALLLTVLDAYALHEVAFATAGAVAWTAASAAVLALLWAAYGLAVPRLRTPLPAAVIAAQFPLFLGALAASAAPLALAWALLATAALDAALVAGTFRRRLPMATPRPAGAPAQTQPEAPAAASSGARSAAPAAPASAPPAASSVPPSSPDARSPRGRSLGAVSHLAEAGAWATGVMALLIALARSVGSSSVPGALPASGLLLAGALLALGAAVLRPGSAPALVAGLAAVASAGGALRPAMPLAWTVPSYLLCGFGVLALASLSRPVRGFRLARPVRLGLAWAAGAVAGGAVLTVLPALTVSVLSVPLASALSPWQGLPATVREAVDFDFPWAAASTGPLITLTVAAVLAAVHRRLPHPATASGALVLAAVAVLLLPTALNLPYAAALCLYVALAGAASALVSRTATPAPEPSTAATAVRTALSYAALATGALTALSASALALASREATFGVLGALLVVCVLLAARTPATVAGAVGSVAAVGYAAGLALAAAAALELPPQHTGLLLLVVPAAVALCAARVPVVPAEYAASVVALLAVALSTAHLPTLALVLALCAVICAGTALRPGRAQARWVAAALFLAATWVRLAASGVATPEAYTLPVTALALAVGFVRRRAEPTASSWTAYGPGLSATLLPSLVATWADPHWLRPLLLGCCALVVTLLGARHRLGAPLLLGGVTLALVAVHELAPYVVQVVGALPRWLPPALAGLLLLAVGATYEQRLRDARRLRERLGRLG
ncbi:SCO7613 C-terminal domain-containing membrane protein [Streptomyces sp. NPDC058657]|uniref:SCO7613 C-terminal domain-containing membrane protein n=1 Tax=unclassified Streptomyces TaxID=2593676 RepID=UPI0036547C5C